MSGFASATSTSVGSLAFDSRAAASGAVLAASRSLQRLDKPGNAEINGVQSAFSSLIGRARNGDKTPGDAARDAAADFVSAALVEPVFKELRSGDGSPPPFGPGPGEKQFRGMLDAQLAQRLTRAAHFPLVDSVAQLLLKGRGAAPGDAPVAAANVSVADGVGSIGGGS